MFHWLRRYLPPLTIVISVVLLDVPPAMGQNGAQEKRASIAGQELLQPGDMIRLRIWREPELSGSYLVDESGMAVFPLLGPMLVTDEPLRDLKGRLTAAYQEYLRNPSIEVVPLRRINILGAVRDPGLHSVDITMTLADAVALAGGSTAQGDMDKIELIRGGERIKGRLSQTTTISDLAIRSGDQLFVPERSWISRNAGVVATAISASVSLVIALFIRR